jgi:hypothetical protein
MKHGVNDSIPNPGVRSLNHEVTGPILNCGKKRSEKDFVAFPGFNLLEYISTHEALLKALSTFTLTSRQYGQTSAFTTLSY